MEVLVRRYWFEGGGSKAVEGTLIDSLAMNPQTPRAGEKPVRAADSEDQMVYRKGELWISTACLRNKERLRKTSGVGKAAASCAHGAYWVWPTLRSAYWGGSNPAAGWAVLPSSEPIKTK